jgi:hypothetical protein
MRSVAFYAIQKLPDYFPAKPLVVNRIAAVAGRHEPRRGRSDVVEPSDGAPIASLWLRLLIGHSTPPARQIALGY